MLPVLPRALAPLRAAWDFYRAYAARVAYYNTLLLLGAVYFGVIGPVALIQRLLGRRLLPHLTPSDTYWLPRAPVAYDLDAWRRMF